jgi:polar amino acid transport system substrate-binding protein
MSRTVVRPALVALAGALLALTGCAPADETPTAGTTPTTPPGTASPTASAPNCAKESLPLVTPGKLTIATDKPVYEPWFKNDDPANGQGFEGAVAAAIAEQMGFAKAEVTWVRVPFTAAIQPGKKKFDFDINEFSITEERKRAVDFSAPYYDVSQAVITTGKSKAAQAKSLADLKGLKIGAQVGTTSFAAIESTIAPSKKPAVYNDNSDAKKALENGQIDALVVDLPTAFYITGAELDDGKIIGQLPPGGGGEQEQFGLVLDKGSKLTPCVDAAIHELHDDGKLKELENQWLSKTGGAPVLS